MLSVAFSAKDNIILNGMSVTDLADGDIATLTFPNDLFTVKTGKSGNALFAINESGRQAELTLRVLRGSTDDKLISTYFLLGSTIPTNLILISGSLSKQINHGNGYSSTDTYILTYGVLSKMPEMKSNVEGDTEQAVTVYTIRFASAVRVTA